MVFLAILGLVTSIFIMILASGTGKFTLISSVSTPYLEIHGDGCTYLLSSSMDENIKVDATVVNGFGSAIWAYDFAIESDGNYTKIAVTQQAEAARLVDEALTRAGIRSSSGETSANKTSKFTTKSSLPTALQYKCMIEIFVPQKTLHKMICISFWNNLT